MTFSGYGLTDDEILKEYYADYKDENEARMHFNCDLCGPYLDVIRWHRYPEERPPRWDYFMVTLISDTGRRLVHERLWFEEEWKAGTDWRNYTVLAWAELPKPYEEESE